LIELFSVDPNLGKTGSLQWFTLGVGVERRNNGEAIDVSATGVVVAVSCHGSRSRTLIDATSRSGSVGRCGAAEDGCRTRMHAVIR
jgi:hypothetical protein